MSRTQGPSSGAGIPALVYTVSEEARNGWEFYLHALNAVCCPAIAIDQLGFVLSANTAMDPVFDEDIRIKNKRLAIAYAQARSHLEALIQRLGSEACTPPHAEPIVIIRDNGRQPVIINSLPLAPGRRNPLLSACAILTFVSLEPKRCPPVSLLIRVFSFTPAEARLAAALTNGMSIEQAAELLNVCCHTARHQLKAVFLKTNTHRQSQLVALLARL
jgi:DNA-binding CsgD family transcriptional regulator